ncbi:MAG: HNH endonuclease, partial [Crocosphaera sp.]
MTEHQQQKNLSYYCRLFSKIKVNKSKKRGEAPYKPILLLSVIDLISQDKIQNNDIYITNELISTFNRYWDILSPDSFNGGLALPFFHLKNDGFWKLQFSQQYDGGRPQTIPKLKEDVDYAILDQELFEFLQDGNSREELINTIISAWFLSSKKEIEDILKINQDLEKENERELKQKKTYLRKSIVRDAFFRKAIEHLYDYKCS